MLCEVKKIKSWLENETVFGLSFDADAFWVDFGSIAAQLKESTEEYTHYFYFSAVIKILRLLDKIRIQPILHQIRRRNNRKSLIFLGEPGTGKTHGVAAETEHLLNKGYHVPLLIQARDIPANATWKDILISSLGLADSWSEEEIWQGLSSLANRKRIHILDEYGHTSILPKILIIVDGVDESSLYDKWIERVQETNAIVQNYPSIRFCFMSRPHVFQGKATSGKIINIDVNGDVATFTLFDSYTKAYGVDIANAGWVKYALTTPLALKLFCEINKGRTIVYHSGADVSIAALLKEKIKILEHEYCKQDSCARPADQYIFRTILLFASLFRNEPRIERSQIISAVSQGLSIDADRSHKLVGYLENYGILRLYCEHSSGLLSPDMYFYYPGIQGYFDYASALMLLDEYATPQNIDFQKCKHLSQNSYYILAIISIQKYSYLITNNDSIGTTLSDVFKEELLFFALRHTRPADAQQYRTQLLQLMAKNAEILRTITNNIVLPLAREPQHPLGVPLLNDFLLGFEYPAQRDEIWSIPSYLRDAEGEKWYSKSELALDQDTYSLSVVDTGDGLATVYAWALSSIDNARRQRYRVALMQWARQVPEEFYKLFLAFSSVNDPQIRSDIFAILMSLLFEDENLELLQSAANWLVENILAPDKIEENRDIAIRHYSTSIVRKAASLNVIDSEKANIYLPPFTPTSNHIALSEEALAGTYMGGYGGITYDLGRYVLIDHITSELPDHSSSAEKQYESLIECIAKDQPQFTGISSEQFILSAAYEFVRMCGWNEKAFRYHVTDEKRVYGVDCAISRSYNPKTHGSQSPVMTICEKYVWQARNYISGFLADRLMYVDDDGATYVSDYGLLDDFLIPALESGQFNPENIIDLYPWHIPEKDVVIISGNPSSQVEVINSVQTAPDVAWKKWLRIDNVERQYPIDGDSLIALSGFSCFECSSGVETNLYINSILVADCDLDCFIDLITKDSDASPRLANPYDWKGGVYAKCYITPKEICWMPWKKRYDSYLVDEFPDAQITSAVDKCVYNFLEYGDVSYELPSAPIRDLLEINNTNGYEFYGKDKKIRAINISMGENWHTQQCYLLVGNSLLSQIHTTGNTIVWIMREQRQETRKARERFGDFYAEKDSSYVGYFRNNDFIVVPIPQAKSNQSNTTTIDDPLSEILAQYRY